MSVTYLTREDWGGGPHRSGASIPNSQIVGLVVHHTVMDRHFAGGDLDGIKGYMRQLQHARPDLGDEVPYSFVVFPGATDDDGVVAEGRGKGWTGAHTTGYNSTRFGCSYAGNASNDQMTPGVIGAYNWIGATMLDNPANALRTIGHRDTKSTECPGNNLYPRLGEIQPPFNSGGLTMADITDLLKAEQDTRKMILSGFKKVLDSEQRTRDRLVDAGVIPVNAGQDSELETDLAEIRAAIEAG